MFISISVISGLFGVYIINTFTDMFGEYVYDVTLEYLLRNFAASVIWGFAACGVFLLVLKSKQLSLVLVAGVIMAISPLFILWRPLISILPLVAYFAALWVTLLIESRKYSLNDYIFIIILISAVAVLMVWFITTSTAGFMNAMLWEMEAEDGLVDGLPRVVNSTIVRDMYFGGVHACYIVMDDYDNMVSQRCY